MTTRLTSKSAAYAVFASLGLFGGLASHRPELVVLGLPFVLGLVASFAWFSWPSLIVSAVSSPARLIEGDEVRVDVSLQADSAVGTVEIAVRLPRGLVADPTTPRNLVVVAEAGTQVETIRYTATRWGSWEIGPIAWRLRDPGRFVVFEEVIGDRLPVRVHPRPEELRRLVQPAVTRALSGSHRARVAAEGIEFAEARPYAAFDDLRDVNWRLTARRGEMWVNRRHPERNSDVVVLLDTFSEATLDSGVRAAVNLVAAYEAEHDRVGIVSFGGLVQWVEPSVGERHLYRLLDVLLSSAPWPSYAWKDLSVLPPRTLPPNALVLAVSGLDDKRVLAVLGDLCDRGTDLAIIEVPFQAMFPRGPQASDRLAHRLWVLRRGDRREELRRRGVPVVEWSSDVPIELMLEEIAAARRSVGRRPR